MTMPNEPEYFAELCREIGCVVLMAQTVEHSLALYLASSLRLELRMSVEDIQRELASANRKYIEKLLREIRKRAPLTADISERFIMLKDERNWMIHRLQRDAPLLMASRSVVEPVFLRIERLSQQIQELLNVLDRIGSDLMQRHGHDLELIEELAAKRVIETNR